MASDLFDSDFLAKLEQLHILSRRLFRSDAHAERRSRRHGSSLEFADYRNYSFGDDLRGIDWNVYGRLDRLFVKLFEEEQDLDIHFLVDVSGSMRWRPENAGERLTKLDQALRIAASLSYIALSNLDRVNIHYFDAALRADMGLSRGKAQFHKILSFLRNAPAAATAETALDPSIRTFAKRQNRKGMVFVLSDFFDRAGFETPLSVLRYHQFEVQVLQVLDPAELDPAMAGDLRLHDAETDSTYDVTADPGLLRRYREAIGAHREALEGFCRRRAIGFAFASTAVSFEDLVLRVLRQGTLLK